MGVHVCVCVRTPCWDQKTGAGDSGGSMMGQSLCFNQPPACVAWGLKGSRVIGFLSAVCQSCITWPDLFAWSVRWSGKFIAAAVSFRWKWNRWQIFFLNNGLISFVINVWKWTKLWRASPSMHSCVCGQQARAVQVQCFEILLSVRSDQLEMVHVLQEQTFFFTHERFMHKLGKRQKQTQKLALTAFKGCHSLISCYDVRRVRVFVCM